VTDAPGRSRWLGESRALSHHFCQAIREILIDEAIEGNWSKRAVAEILSARSETTVARPAGQVVETDDRGAQKWWTFGGLKANASLASMLMRDGVLPRFDNYFVEILRASGIAETEGLLRAAQEINTPVGSATGDPPSRIKFWECIPDELRKKFVSSRFFDTEGAEKLLSESRVYVDQPANPPPR
jgi:ATP-dependent Lhr-like helicase